MKKLVVEILDYAIQIRDDGYRIDKSGDMIAFGIRLLEQAFATVMSHVCRDAQEAGMDGALAQRYAILKTREAVATVGADIFIGHYDDLTPEKQDALIREAYPTSEEHNFFQ